MNFRAYVHGTPAPVLAIDLLRAFAIVVAPLAGLLLMRWVATTDLFVAPLHRRLFFHPDYQGAGAFYRAFVIVTFALTGGWVASSIRTFVAFTLRRTGRDAATKNIQEEKLPLPPWPYARDPEARPARA